MSNLDRLMEFVLATVFLCTGLVTVFGVKRRLAWAGARQMIEPIELPPRSAIPVGLFEIVAALALVVPIAHVPSAIVAPLAAAALAVLAAVACIYRVRRHQECAPTVALFLLAVFVVFARLHS